MDDLNDPLANYAYMFWDASQISVRGFNQNPDDPLREELIVAIFDVLEQTLTIPHAVCREAALHGLGHTLMGGKIIHNEPFETTYSKRVERIIDEFLKTADIEERLGDYALQARTGMIN